MVRTEIITYRVSNRRDLLKISYKSPFVKSTFWNRSDVRRNLIYSLNTIIIYYNNTLDGLLNRLLVIQGSSHYEYWQKITIQEKNTSEFSGIYAELVKLSLIRKYVVKNRITCSV